MAFQGFWVPWPSQESPRRLQEGSKTARDGVQGGPETRKSARDTPSCVSWLLWWFLGLSLGCLGALLVPLGAVLELSWGVWGLSWTSLGAVLGCPGAVLGRFGALLGLSRAVFGLSWGCHGPSQRELLGASWGFMEPPGAPKIKAS